MKEKELTNKRRKRNPIAIVDTQESKSEIELIPHQSKIKKALWMGFLFSLGLAILSGFVVSSYQDEGSAQEVVSNRISSSTNAGEALIDDETNANIEARDFEVTNAGPDGGEARMLIWDFNLEDFDEVAILVDGIPVKERIILASNAAAISIPVPSTVTIQGVTDNGGGISYAVKFPNNKMTYFNVVAIGQSNTYTVLPLP